MRRPLVRAVFAALAVATFAAFVVAQQLKSEFPLVIRFAAQPGDFSPNGDGTSDFTFVGFDLSRPAEVKFSIVDAEGKEVRTFVDGKRLAGDRKYRYLWHGRDDHGRRLPDGTYRMRLIRRDEGRVINSLKEVVIDTRRPRVFLTSARPGVITPGVRGRQGPVRIRYRGPRNKHPEFRIFRTDGGPPRVVARFRGDKHKGASWYGTTRGRLAADGDYAFTVTVRDKAGNRGVAPRAVPTPSSALPGTGVAVRRLTLGGPLGAASPGSLVSLRVGPVRRRLRFSVTRLGGRRPVRRGVRSGGPFRVRIPRTAHAGVYLVTVRAAGRRATWPVAVSAAAPRRVPLVVLPAITWQGLNPVDDDLDGFADTLESARSVQLSRPFARGRMPRGFWGQVTPLLRFLDAKHLRYELTTDLALAQRRGPKLEDAPGALFAGNALWLPDRLQNILRTYVQVGDPLAFLGQLPRRDVAIQHGGLVGRGVDTGFDLTELVRGHPTPLTVAKDDLGLFGGQGLVGQFSVFERARGVRRPLLTSAGRDGQRDFEAYRLGKGLVIRTGTPQWASQLASNPAVADATVRIWRLLRRG